jgi:hypothetical protein
VIEAAVPLAFVKANVADGVTPDTAAVTLYEPTLLFAVNVVEVATPEALEVVTKVGDPLKAPPGPELGAVNVTVTPDTAFPNASFTVATKGDVNAVLIFALWPEPLLVVIEAGPPGLLVSEKDALPETPVVAATTAYEPTILLAVNATEATPDTLVVAEIVVTPPVNLPLAPLVGAVNVTVAPLMGLLFESFTVADRRVAKAVLTVAL